MATEGRRGPGRRTFVFTFRYQKVPWGEHSLDAAMRKKRKMGRPRLPKGKTKTAQIGVRFRSDEMAKLQRAATAAGFAISEMVRAFALSELARAKAWVRSEWQAEELDGNLIEFDIATTWGPVRGVGVLSATGNAKGQITVSIAVKRPVSAGGGRIVDGEFRLSAEAVGRIEPHPNKDSARFFISG
jgi:hypothetical protein